MLAIKLAIKNLIGAGLRTWLNVAVLSFAFVTIVFYNGMLEGWNIQAQSDTKDWDIGAGQLWHSLYDPYDPYCLQDAHAPLSETMKSLVEKKQITPVLISQASIYPQGHLQNVLMKGIDPSQEIIKLPTSSLKAEGNAVPVVIGKRMALSAKVKKGDRVLIRWRDKNGTFDAKEIKIVEVFNSNVPAIDNGQIWMPLDQLQEMTGMENQATLFIVGKSYAGGDIEKWQFKDLDFLLQEIKTVIAAKKTGSSIINALLLAIALLAIFDTQVLSIFRRQKEIGTYIALGMTRLQVVKIFTVEGSMHSLFAIILGTLYGIPLLGYLQKIGIPMPKSTDQYGLSISDKIIPVYSMGLIFSSLLLVILSATIVSYFPTRRISKMNPTDALKGKIQ